MGTCLEKARRAYSEKTRSQGFVMTNNNALEEIKKRRKKRLLEEEAEREIRPIKGKIKGRQ